MKNITDLNEELILETVKKFSDVEISPYWSSIYRTGNLPNGLFDKMVNLGLLLLTVPEEYGGVGANTDVACKVIYELSKRSASVGCILKGHYKTVDQAMTELNNEYDELFNKLKNTHKNKDGETYTKETAETPEQFKAILHQLFSLKMSHFESPSQFLS